MIRADPMKASMKAVVRRTVSAARVTPALSSVARFPEHEENVG